MKAFKPHTFTLTVFILFACALTQPAYSYLMWAAERDDRIIHVLAKVDFFSHDDHLPLPDAVEQALTSSQVIVFETATDPEERREVSGQVARAARYPRGSDLLHHIPQDIAVTLKETCAGLQISLTRISQVEPWAAAYNLDRVTTQKAGVEHLDALDKYFAERAAAENIGSDFLIKPAEYIRHFKGLPKTVHVGLLKKALHDAGRKKSIITDYAKVWRSGSAEDAAQLIAESYSAYPELRGAVLDPMSVNWAGKLDAMTRFDDRIFVIIPLEQTVGDQGVLEKLRALGFSVRQVN